MNEAELDLMAAVGLYQQPIGNRADESAKLDPRLAAAMLEPPTREEPVTSL